jgi:hypothetical protein
MGPGGCGTPGQRCGCPAGPPSWFVCSVDRPGLPWARAVLGLLDSAAAVRLAPPPGSSARLPPQAPMGPGGCGTPCPCAAGILARPGLCGDPGPGASGLGASDTCVACCAVFFSCAGDTCSSPVATGPLCFRRADLPPRQLLVRPPLGQPHPELAAVGRGSSCRATLSTSPCRCT